MRHILAGVITAVLWTGTAFAQPHDVQRGAVYAEMLGNGMLICCTGNLDWMTSSHVSVRVGAGPELLSDEGGVWSRLLMLNYLFGRDGRYLEVGAGIVTTNTLLVLDTQKPRTGGTFSIAVREQRDGRSLRVAVTPLLPVFSLTGRPKLMIGVSRGYSW
jgi:hypothetical protein